MTKYTLEMLSALDNTFTRMKGVQITKEEYDLICKRMDEIKVQVLLPAAIIDIARKENG